MCHDASKSSAARLGSKTRTLPLRVCTHEPTTCGADPASCLHCCVLLCSDNADLEAVLKETERQRREFAARYAFMTLDTDGDGYVSVEQVGRSCEM